MSVEERFSRVYRKGEWAVRGVLSGDGSRIETTRPVAAWLESEAAAGMRSVLDLGCGDLAWIAACPAITERRLRYYGIDVVPSLIAHHRRIYPWFNGEAADLEALPRLGGSREHPQDTDIILLKDVLFHLCNGAAGQILMYVERAAWKRLLVSTHPGADNLKRRGLKNGLMADLDVEATGLLSGSPSYYLPRPGGCYAVYERD
jgi:hypothetical protein